jgi:Transglycosylase SLT domain
MRYKSIGSRRIACYLGDSVTGWGLTLVMRQIGLVIAIAVLALPWRSASAEQAQYAGSPPGMQCRRAIDQAERAVKVPGQLLAAIGRVETGRWDPQSSNWYPWPWTINTGGDGRFFETKAQAIAAVRALQAHGVTSIDVGCMQVNLMHHPSAFSSLEQAFDPQSNALYAAHFLDQLFTQTNDWKKAAALYHSATPELGADYRRRVLAAWPEETRLQPSLVRDKLAEAWAATLRGRPQPQPITVVLISPGNHGGSFASTHPNRPEVHLATYRHPRGEPVPAN